MPPQIIGPIPDSRADTIIARCVANRPGLTPYKIESDMIGILSMGTDDPDYYTALLNAARRAKEAPPCS